MIIISCVPRVKLLIMMIIIFIKLYTDAIAILFTIITHKIGLYRSHIQVYL